VVGSRRHLLVELECVEDQVADVLGDLWDYGVTEGFKSVHPVGNPISHSTHGGFKGPLSE
jgi:hypothetical protein